MKARDVLTRRVISVTPDATVLQAARLMLQHHISGLPVVDAGGALVGILSEGDFLRRSETTTERRRSRWLEFLMGPGTIAAEYTRSHRKKVSEVMTDEVQTVDEDTDLEAVTDVTETDKDIEITAELPGLEEKDVQINLADNMLTIRGEKKAEKEEKDKNYRVVERSYGSFERTIALPEGVKAEDVKATIAKGVLRVTVRKPAPAQAKTIEVKPAA